MSEVGETKESRMAVGLRSDASTVRTSRTHTSTHVRVGLLQRCLSVSEMPRRETEMSMSQGLSQSNTCINGRHMMPLSTEHSALQAAVTMLLDEIQVYQ